MKKLILIMAFAVAMISCTISNEGVTGTGGKVIITKAALEEAFPTVLVPAQNNITKYELNLPTAVKPADTVSAIAYNNSDLGFGPNDSIARYKVALKKAIEKMIVAPTPRDISKDFASLDNVYIERTDDLDLDYNAIFTDTEDLTITVTFRLENGASTIDGKDTMSLVYKMDVGA